MNYYKFNIWLIISSSHALILKFGPIPPVQSFIFITPSKPTSDRARRLTWQSGNVLIFAEIHASYLAFW